MRHHPHEYRNRPCNMAERFPRQGSDVLSFVAWADGLVEIAENTNVHPGDMLRYLPFSEWAR
jgi:molybdopterin biosynthesis enzyme